LVAIEGQSPEIAQSVTSESIEETGAGDQVTKKQEINKVIKSFYLGDHVRLCH
jgi:hypothetical protein